MATIPWPSTLPQVYLEADYAEGLANNVIKDQFDVGPATFRRRATSAPFPISGSMVMTTDEWEELKDFFYDVLLQGSLAFGIPEQGVEGSPTDEWLVRFIEPPTRERMGFDWRVTLQLEVLP